MVSKSRRFANNSVSNLWELGHSERVGSALYRNVPGDYDLHLFTSARAYFSI